MKRFLWIAVLFAGCFHTKETQTTAQSKEAPSDQQQGKRVAAPRPVGTTPASILRADGIREIQKKLKVAESGDLDDHTRKALEKFQRQEHLASTGEPDMETVEKLGLDVDDIFQSGSRKKEDDRAARKNAKTQAHEERVKQ